MTLHPRPASPGVSTTVETDHPHGDDHVTLFTCQPPALAGVHSMHEKRPGRPSHSRARVAAGSGPAACPLGCGPDPRPGGSHTTGGGPMPRDTLHGAPSARRLPAHVSIGTNSTERQVTAP